MNIIRWTGALGRVAIILIYHYREAPPGVQARLRPIFLRRQERAKIIATELE